jgi:tRNA U55 pseudouridine synthase TruB
MAVAKDVIPIDALLPEVPGVIVDDQGARRASHGNLLEGNEVSPAAGYSKVLPNKGNVRILDRRGNLLAIGEYLASGALHPKIVLV